MPDKIALFDMDGTLFDYERKLRQSLADLSSENEPDPRKMNIWDESIPWLKARMHLIKSVPGWWRDLPKLKVGWVLLDAAKKLGFSIQILTKGPKSKSHAWAEKVECIQKHCDDDIGINIVMDKGGKYGRVLVDDFPEYALRWLECRSRGLVIMPVNINNKGFTHPNVIPYEHTDDNCDHIMDIKVANALKAAMDRAPKQHWKDLL